MESNFVAKLDIEKFMMTSSNGNIFALLAICAGNSPVTGEFPTQRSVTRSFDVSFDARLNKPLSKQSWGWWFETPSRPLWRHSNNVPDTENYNALNEKTMGIIGYLSRFFFLVKHCKSHILSRILPDKYVVKQCTSQCYVVCGQVHLRNDNDDFNYTSDGLDMNIVTKQSLESSLHKVFISQQLKPISVVAYGTFTLSHVPTFCDKWQTFLQL